MADTRADCADKSVSVLGPLMSTHGTPQIKWDPTTRPLRACVRVSFGDIVSREIRLSWLGGGIIWSLTL